MAVILKKTMYRIAALTIMSFLLILAAGGCGVQRKEVNEALRRADRIQGKVEAALESLSRFPDEWADVFASGVNQQSIKRAGELLQARLSELEALKPKMRKIEQELKKIQKFNIDRRVKEYARLRISVVDIYSEYIDDNLWTILKTYEGLLVKLATGASREELDVVAREIVDLVGKAVEKLDECKGAAKQADEYFLENSLGRKT